jgi:hypothetical protein
MVANNWKRVIAVDVMFIEIGSAENLSKEALETSVKCILSIIDKSPNIQIDITIGGYDDDPRELYEIEEVVNYVISFAKAMMNNNISSSQFLKDTIALISLCVAKKEGNM